MKKQPETADHFLTATRRIVRERGRRRGRAFHNHKSIAILWGAYLGMRKAGPLEAWEVAIMMQLLKIARMHNGEYDRDHDFDNIGFASLAAELRGLFK